MKLSFGEYTIQNSSRQIDYIEKIFENVEKRYQTLLDFFKLEKLNKPIRIVLWDDLEAFRADELKSGKRTLPMWVCGISSTKDDHHLIRTLTLEELCKAQGHQNSTEKDLENLILHEIVHAFVRCIVGDKLVKRWLNEGLATSLAKQRHAKANFDCSEEKLLFDTLTNYSNFHVIGNYLINEKGSDYVLKLLTDSKFLQQELASISSGANEYFNSHENALQ